MCVPHYQTYLFAKQLQEEEDEDEEEERQQQETTNAKPRHKDKLRRTYRCLGCETLDESMRNGQDIGPWWGQSNRQACVKQRKKKNKGPCRLDTRIRRRYKIVGHVDSLTYTINVTI